MAAPEGREDDAQEGPPHVGLGVDAGPEAAAGGPVDPTPGYVEDLLAAIPSESARRLFDAGLEAFATLGYHGTSTRDIAARASMSPAALYVHFKTKSDLLFEISRLTHQAVLRNMQAAFAMPANPEGRLRNVVATHVQWHAALNTAARVANYELDALPPAQRGAVVAIRAQISGVMREAVRLGVAAGEFAVEDLGATSVALLSLGVDVSRWFRPGRRLTPPQLGRLYADLAVRMVTER